MLNELGNPRALCLSR